MFVNVCLVIPKKSQYQGKFSILDDANDSDDEGDGDDGDGDGNGHDNEEEEQMLVKDQEVRFVIECREITVVIVISWSMIQVYCICSGTLFGLLTV